MTTAREQGGFTLIEILISALILMVIAGVLGSSMSHISNMTVTGGIETQLQQMGERALLRILDDLRRSGFIEEDDLVFPHFFENGAASGDFSQHAHPPAHKEARSGEPDFGPDREIVFLLPRDDDVDRIPDLDSNSELLWDGRQISYVLISGADGVNRLERRTDAGSPQTIAHHLERVCFEDAPAASFEIPLKAVRVHLFFRRRDAAGTLYRHHAEATIRLRNGGISGDPR